MTLIETTFSKLPVGATFRLGDAEFDRLYKKINGDQGQPTGDDTIKIRIRSGFTVYVEVLKEESK